MTERVTLTHPFAPVADEQSRVLVLGTFPSVQSRQNEFYYGHPRNRFWPVMAAVLKESVPTTIAEKKAMLLRHGVALWDVLEACAIRGSADVAIRDPKPNDIPALLHRYDIRRVYVNGRTAEALYRRFCLPLTQLQAVALPSTSPANAAWNEARLIAAWEQIAENGK